MAEQRISKRFVDGLRAAESEFTAWDMDLPGFGVRVRPNGSRSYIVVYRAGHGRKAPVRKLTLGPTTKLTPDEARNLARKALGAAAHGQDPAAERSVRLQGMTVAELAETFLAEHVSPKRKNRTVESYTHALRGHIVPALGTTKAEQLTTAAVAKLHLNMRDRPAAANYALAVIGSMYGFGQRRGYVSKGCNPAEDIDRYANNSRERFLTSAELARLGEVLREAETTGIPWQIDESKPNAKHAPHADKRRSVFAANAVGAVRLLILTGCRLREILDLQWSSVDIERGMLFLPDSKTGRKQVVLNAPAIAVLHALPRVGSFVIPGRDPDRPRHDLQKIWAAVTRRARLNGVRLHDLRHTFASVGAADGLGLPIVGKLLGHAQAATTARYAHLDNDPVRRASEQIGASISRAMGGAKLFTGSDDDWLEDEVATDSAQALGA